MENPGSQIKSRPSKVPKAIAYRDVNDLYTLKDWFYNFSSVKDQRYRAIQRVNSLLTRGKLPHAVEITSHLTSICISDPTIQSDYPKQRDTNVLKLSYTMALIRFVNGLLDPFQQGNFAISLHTLANNIGLPSFFVELRHMGTHEQLPNLDILRIACAKALNWLFDNYWCQIEKIEIDDDVPFGIPPILMDKTADSLESDVEIANHISAYLKTYKKLRKQSLDVPFDKNDSTRDGIRFWKSIKNIQEVIREDRSYELLLNALIFQNFLIYNHDKLRADKSGKKFKFNSLLIKLYKCLLDKLGTPFKQILLKTMLRHYETPEIGGNNNGDLKSPKLIHENELVQVEEWINFLITDIQSTPDYDATQDVISLFENCEEQTQLRFIPVFEKEFTKCNNSPNSDTDQIKSSILKKLTKMKNVAKMKRFAVPPPLDPITAPSGNHDSTLSSQNNKRHENSQNLPAPAKKQKKLKPDQFTCFILEEHENWKPLPFGVCP